VYCAHIVLSHCAAPPDQVIRVPDRLESKRNQCEHLEIRGYFKKKRRSPWSELHEMKRIVSCNDNAESKRLVSRPRRLVPISGPGRAVPPKSTVRVSNSRRDNTTTNAVAKRRKTLNRCPPSHPTHSHRHSPLRSHPSPGTTNRPPLFRQRPAPPQSGQRPPVGRGSSLPY